MATLTPVTLMGHLSVFDAADVADIASVANLKSAGRLGDSGAGKRAGQMILRKNGTDDYDLMIATGALPESKWLLFEMGTIVTPS